MRENHVFCDRQTLKRFSILKRHAACFTSLLFHHRGVIIGAMASQITNLIIVYSTVYWDADHWTHQSSTPLAFVRRIHRWPVNSPHKWPVTRKIFPVDDVIMLWNVVFSHLAETKSMSTETVNWKWAPLSRMVNNFPFFNCQGRVVRLWITEQYYLFI